MILTQSEANEIVNYKSCKTIWPSGGPIPGKESDWEKIAERIMKGQFDKEDKGTKEALAIGLRGFETMRCKQAVIRLEEVQIAPTIVKPKAGGSRAALPKKKSSETFW